MKSYGDIQFKQDGDGDGIPDQINLLLPPQAGNSDKVLITRNGKLIWESLNSNLLAKAGLGTINITNPVSGDVLYYNGSEWEAKSIAPVSNFGYWSGGIPEKSGTTVVSETAIPTISDGTEIMSQVVVPLSTASQFTITFAASVTTPVNGSNCIVFLMRRIMNGNGVWGNWVYLGGCASASSIFADSMTTAAFIITDHPNASHNVEYAVRIGASRGAWYVNRGASKLTFGLKSGWSIKEF